MRGGRRIGLAIAGMMVAVVGAIAQPDLAAEPPADEMIGAADLGDLDEPSSILDSLDPDERDAYERSGMTGAQPPTPENEQLKPAEGTLDKIGNATMSVLVVAVSAAAAVAPYLLF